MSNEDHWRRWLAELRRWLNRCVAVKDAWNVMLFGDHWFCPYCGKAVVLTGGDDKILEQRVDHLVDQCEGFKEVGDPVKFPADALRKRALGMFVKRSLASSAAWQMRDVDGRWICPYCTHPSEVKIGAKIDKQALTNIVEVVAACPAYAEKGLEGFVSVDEIREAGVKRQTMQASIAELTEWMTDD